MTVNTLGSHESRPSRTVAEWLWPFVPMGVAAFSLSALVYYHLWQNVFTVSSPLQQFYAWLYRVVGFAPAVMFFGLTILWSTIWLASGRIERPASRFLRLFAMTVMLGVFLNLGDGGVSPSSHTGVLGAWFAETLTAALGYWPSLLLVWAITFASLLLATDFFFHESFERLRLPPPLPDAGVEAAVADHLRGLASVVPVANARPAASTTATTAAMAVAGDVATAAATAAPSVEAPPAAEPPRRRTYAERRAERSWHRPSDEDWVPPPGPESQEIDNPETRDASASAAAVAPAAAAPEVPPASGSEIEAATVEHAASIPDVGEPPRAVEIEAGEIDEAAEATEEAEDAEPPVELPRPVPLVWPDEVAASADAASEPGVEPAAIARAPGGSPEPPPIDEPLVSIPRPAAPVARDPEPDEPPIRQQDLFAARIDETLMQEAIEVVTGARRASVTLLQRKLHIDYATAALVLAELAARGVIALEGDATQGRVLG